MRRLAEVPRRAKTQFRVSDTRLDAQEWRRERQSTAWQLGHLEIRCQQYEAILGKLAAEGFISDLGDGIFEF